MMESTEPSGPPPGSRIAAWQRDWSWLRSCPLLIDPGSLRNEAFPADPFPDWLRSAWENPLATREPLERLFASRACQRVGYYAEALTESALAGSPEVADLRSGVQIRDARETLGELDFLFRHEGRLHHLEIALKFYLHHPEVTLHGSSLLGPNVGDTFERKAARLRDHQLPLGRRTFPEIKTSLLFCPGIIFYHPEAPDAENLPDALSPEHARGTWLHAGEFRRWIARHDAGAVGAVLEKPTWLGADPTMEPDRLADEIETHFGGSRRPLLLAWNRNPESAESERVFVVDDDWPNRPR